MNVSSLLCQATRLLQLLFLIVAICFVAVPHYAQNTETDKSLGLEEILVALRTRIRDYSKAIELNPKDASAYYNRGLIYDDKKNYEEAILDYTNAIKIDSKFADAYFNRGYIYLE